MSPKPDPTLPPAYTTACNAAMEPEIKDDEMWKNGDSEVISSDNVRFRIDSFYLLANCSVFRDMYSLDAGGDRTIVLTDEDSDDAKTLRLFLELATTGKFIDEVSHSC
ncbi:hypothetical protein CspHIS471_0602250 [Cutaneotrichosporon sp. HIS471]|nr:hypothetical protein CspHIS471_0602250 [Cutaneotrichosporon sp. HIS471]